MMKAFITYGFGHRTERGQSLAGCYSLIEGNDWDDILTIAHEKTKGIFATSYPIEDLQRQIEQHNLIEVPFEKFGWVISDIDQESVHKYNPLPTDIEEE